MAKPDAPLLDQAAGYTRGAATLGARLRTLRERHKLQQAEVAAALDVSRPTVSEWENDIKQPARENARRLAMFYRVSLDWLMAGGVEPITVDDPDEARMLSALRQAPDNIREAVQALLRPYAEAPAQEPAKRQ